MWQNMRTSRLRLLSSTRSIGLAPRTLTTTAWKRNAASTAIPGSPKPSSPKAFGNRLLKLFLGGTAIGIAFRVGTDVGKASADKRTNKRHRFVENTPQHEYLHKHPLVQQLRADSQFVESLYCDEVPFFHQDVMVTTGMLSGDGLLTVEPLVFTSKDPRGDMYIFYHVGHGLTHHKPSDQFPGAAVHTGLLATLMDEGLARSTFRLLPRKYGVTATLDLSYESPVAPDSFLVLRTQAGEATGRKARTMGSLEVLQSNSSIENHGPVVVKGSVLMVEPKWGKYVLWIRNFW